MSKLFIMLAAFLRRISRNEICIYFNRYVQNSNSFFFTLFFKLSRLPELCRKTRTIRRRKQTFQKETSRLSGETHFTMQCWTSQSSLLFRVGLQFFCLLSENARSFLSDRQIRCHKSIMKCVDYITRLHNNLFVEKKIQIQFC